MTASSKDFSYRHREGLLSGVSAGFFFILAGAIFIATPNLVEKITDLFQPGAWNASTQVPNTQIPIPTPESLGSYTTIYAAVAQFCMIWGIFLIVLLIARALAHSPLRKKAENASDIVFWLGASYLIPQLLNESTQAKEWFMFWSEIIVLAGVSLVVRAAVLAGAQLTSRD